VTIIAGFRSSEGVIVCADTQETVEGTKRNVPKLRFESRLDLETGTDDLAVAFCGSTDNGPFVDEIIDRAWKDAQTGASMDEVCEKINKSLKQSYKEFGRIYQPGYCPTAELVYGVKMQGDSKLFYAYGPAVNEKENYATGGTGRIMADFLAARMQVLYPTLRQCIIIAAYVLFEAKEHIEGCGGESHIAILRNDAGSGRLDSNRTEVLTKLVEPTDTHLASILLGHADLTIPDDVFRQQAADAVDMLVFLREQKRVEIKEWENLWEGIFNIKNDDLGLPENPNKDGKSDGS
jgi:hypothetical protein